MITAKDIHNFDARYHRNGSQEGFFLCSFTFGRGKRAIAMRAVVFGERDWGSVAVFSDAIDARWDGGQFSTALRDAIEKFDTDNPHKLYKPL